MAIYLVTQNQTQRLISANNQAAARSFAARSTIEVKVATTVEAIALTAAGIKVEDSGNNPDQLLLPEIPVQGDVTPDARWAETV